MNEQDNRNEEVKTNAARQQADDCQTEKLADLPVAVDQAEQTKGGKVSKVEGLYVKQI